MKNWAIVVLGIVAALAITVERQLEAHRIMENGKAEVRHIMEEAKQQCVCRCP